MDEEKVYAVVGNQQCRTWNIADLNRQGGFWFDRRISPTIKMALGAERKLFIASLGEAGGGAYHLQRYFAPGIAVYAHLNIEEQVMCPFPLPDKDFVPVDFDGTYVM